MCSTLNDMFSQGNIYIYVLPFVLLSVHFYWYSFTFRFNIYLLISDILLRTCSCTESYVYYEM